MTSPISRQGSPKRYSVMGGLVFILLLVGAAAYVIGQGARDEGEPGESGQDSTADTFAGFRAKSKTPQASGAPASVSQVGPLVLPGSQMDTGRDSASSVPLTFSDADRVAARRLEPAKPRSVAWDESCQKEALSESVAALNPESMVRSIRDSLRGHQEFPEGVHVVRWEMAFGLPHAGVVLWAEWLGTRPSTYRVVIQDSRAPRESWDARGMAPVKTLAVSLNWEATRNLLVQTKQDVLKSVGQPDYRRLLATTETDDLVPEPSEGASVGAPQRTLLGVELLGARVLWYSQGPASCLRRNDDAMVCFCGPGHPVEPVPE